MNTFATPRSIARAARRARLPLAVPAMLLAAGAASLLTACGDDADALADGVLAVTLADFDFGDLPSEVAAGTRLEIENVSSSELHELVAIRLPDDEARSGAEIIENGLGELLAGGPPHAVLLAAPGGEQIAAVGDGVLHEPGRYLLLCAIPTGADPAEYLAAAAESDGPPQVAGGAPHFAHGMWAELIVTPD